MDNWNKQIKLARYMLLGTVIVTVLNLAFLLGNVDLYISYSAALPYYLVWLGKLMDNGLYVGAANGTYTATGLVMAGVLLGLWLLLWWLSGDSRRCLTLGMLAVAADAVLLVLISVMLIGNFANCLWDLVIHAAVIWEMNQGLKAWKQKEAALQAENAQFAVSN